VARWLFAPETYITDASGLSDTTLSATALSPPSGVPAMYAVRAWIPLIVGVALK
jgi:hypothetical protein